MSWPEKLKQVSDIRPEKEKKLRDSIAKLKKGGNRLPLDIQNQLFNDLSSTLRPHIKQREFQIALGNEPDKVCSHAPEFNIQAKDVAAALLKLNKLKLPISEISTPEMLNGEWVELTHARSYKSLSGEREICITWDDLSANEKRSARRLWSRFWKEKVAFQNGRPEYPYTSLVLEYIDHIETATGKRLGICRKVTETEDAKRVEKSGKPAGPAFETLVAALNLSLFASEAPPRETLVSIIKRKRTGFHHFFINRI